MLPTIPIFQPTEIQIPSIIQQAESNEPESKQAYTIRRGDTLTSIAKAHSTTVQRLWSANPTLTHPDELKPLETLRIPQKDEKLESRPMPERVIIKSAVFQSASSPSTQRGYSNLTGSIGRVSPYGNCVNEPGVNRASGNPITWPVLFYKPRIGATALWTYNHTGVVTGIYSDGSIEVRHQNWKGSDRTRFYPYEIRGYR